MKRLQAQLDAQQKSIDALINALASSDTKIDGLTTEIVGLETKIVGLETKVIGLKTEAVGMEQKLTSGRKHSRDMAYSPMLNTYLNIIKFAQMTEPSPKKRRCSKHFQNKSSTAPMELFLKVIYPYRAMGPAETKEYFKKADSFKDQRDRITHPRSIVELADEAHRYASMLEEHQTYGDALDANERMFLDVFSKIDELRSCGIGNL